MTERDWTAAELDLILDVAGGRRDPAEPAVARQLAADPELRAEIEAVRALGQELDAAGDVAARDVRAALRAPPSAEQLAATRSALGREPVRPSRRGLLAAALVLVGAAIGAVLVWDHGRGPERDVTLGGPERAAGMKPDGGGADFAAFSWQAGAGPAEYFRLEFYDAPYDGSTEAFLVIPDLEGHSWHPDPGQLRTLQQRERIHWRLIRERADGTTHIEGEADAWR